MMIRQMVMSDIPQLAQLYKQFWHEDSCIDTMYKQFDKFSANDTHVLLSAVEDEQLIGSVMGVICEELYGDCKPFMVLENMIVDSKYRNGGVGKVLLAEIERIATLKGCAQIILVTETNRRDACTFYESAGYHPDTHRGFKKKL